MSAASVSQLGRNRAAGATEMGLSRRIKAFFIARNVERRTFDELDMTSDRELADLGLSRYDVRALAKLAGRQAAEKFLAA